MQLLLNGLSAGCIYGLIALGFVLIYKATEMVNFAQGDLLMLVGVGLLGGTAQLFITRAYGLAPASVAAPFDYTHLIWSVLFGWYFWGDFPDLQTWIGCAIVVASGLYILYRETVRRQRVPRVWTE